MTFLVLEHSKIRFKMPALQNFLNILNFIRKKGKIYSMLLFLNKIIYKYHTSKIKKDFVNASESCRFRFECSF